MTIFICHEKFDSSYYEQYHISEYYIVLNRFLAVVVRCSN